MSHFTDAARLALEAILKATAEQRERQRNANVWGESGPEYVTGFDPASPGGDYSAYVTNDNPPPNNYYAKYKRKQGKPFGYTHEVKLRRVYTDPQTGLPFYTIELDTFKKSKSVWTTLGDPVYQKYKKFLSIFDVQDAVIL